MFIIISSRDGPEVSIEFFIKGIESERRHVTTAEKLHSPQLWLVAIVGEGCVS